MVRQVHVQVRSYEQAQSKRRRSVFGNLATCTALPLSQYSRLRPLSTPETATQHLPEQAPVHHLVGSVPASAMGSQYNSGVEVGQSRKAAILPAAGELAALQASLLTAEAEEFVKVGLEIARIVYDSPEVGSQATLNALVGALHGAHSASLLHAAASLLI